MQRAVTDFGADGSFANASKKMKEHYALELPESSIRLILKGHAEEIQANLEGLQESVAVAPNIENIIAEIDGSMVPIVTINNEAEGDKRKTRTREWREARLSLARSQGSIRPFFCAAIGSTDEAGKQLKYAVASVKGKQNPRIHGLGDGALWIAEQFEVQFGANGDFLIDFYHMSEYMNAAAKCCSEVNQREWFHNMQALMKNNKTDMVVSELENHINQKNCTHDCAAAKCHKYITNRPNQFNYKNAIDKNLPIGSGEIESAHRSIVQKRLKIPGAAWLVENANSMLAMMTLRANGFWNTYWNGLKLKVLAN